MSNGKGPDGNGAGSDQTLPASAAGAFTGSGITPLLSVDQIVDGRYRVLAALDHGGMGQVYKVEHTTLGSYHALKIYHPASGSTPAAQFADRFVEEARLLVAIRHPNVVSVTDAGSIEVGGVSHPFYVMELLEGNSLKRLLACIQISTARAIAITLQVAEALKAVHEKGIVHRDLKPDNIFLTDSPQGDCVRVIDFGIAKVNRQGGVRTEAGLVIGTPAYMAPEQAAGKSVDCRADVYSLGAVLYEMLTGTPPFGRDDFLEIFQRQATETPASPSATNATVSEGVSAVALKAIARTPEDRYGSVEDFRVALTQAWEVASRVSPGTTSKIMVAPRWPLYGAIAIILATLGFLVAMVLGGSDSATAPKPSAVAPQSAPAPAQSAPTQVSAPTAASKPSAKAAKRRVRKVEEAPQFDPDEVPGESGAPVRRRQRGR